MQKYRLRLNLEMGLRNAVPSRNVFTGERCRDAFRLNNFLASMRNSDLRELFHADPEKAMDRFALNERERDLIRKRDYQGMLDYGAVIYAISKAATAFRTTLLSVGAQMRGEPSESVVEWITSGKNAVRE
jgi:gallate dioxygenase